ncbi:TPA: hypothetical protein DDZ86_02095 [Candidatus Dependentiae bacterium]|nr:MAG: ATP synthase gamma chain [candidate division TM6 bacterium GW2011_GWF2_43_87]HBL98415.1 hypothetical protein [Candidatus Dependentiae bacterium]
MAPCHKDVKMSHIIHLRQRIKTVAMIQKTTHAMRLTSMSTHAHLNKKKVFLEQYSSELEKVLESVKHDVTPVSVETENAPTPCFLTIVVGSQKGLCGSFNIRLLRFFEEHKDNQAGNLIAIGKKIIELVEPQHHLHYSFPAFTATNFFALSAELCQHILGNTGYTKLTIYSNYPQSFFIQRPIVTVIDVPQPLPEAYAIRHPKASTTESSSGYLYDQPAPEILATLDRFYLKIRVEEILFNSLIAEHAARFISMDASSTNAAKILEEMKRDYNKLRQASITRELMDLIGGFA